MSIPAVNERDFNQTVLKSQGTGAGGFLGRNGVDRGAALAAIVAIVSNITTVRGC
jgi:hypothetical protein